MTEYLRSAQADAVRDAAVDLFGADPQMRPLLFEGVLPRYVTTLPRLDAPGLQIASDLMRINRVDRLVDGSVPLQIWLQNAQRYALQPAARNTFQDALDIVATAASGEPALGVAGEVDVAEAVVFRDDTVAFGFLTRGAAAGKAVARLTVSPVEDGQPQRRADGQPANPFIGTGWLITPSLLVTNHHVVNARAMRAGRTVEAAPADLRSQLSTARVEFDYDDVEDAAGMVIEGTELVASSIDLDYAMLRLSTDSGRDALCLHRGQITATLDDNMAVNVIQHPNGKEKRVGLRNNIVLDTTAAVIRYFTDTRDGSSGSPVLTDEWRVCALHRGARRVDVLFQGKRSAVVNVGTQTAAIIDDLAARFPDIAEEVTAAAT